MSNNVSRPLDSPFGEGLRVIDAILNELPPSGRGIEARKIFEKLVAKGVAVNEADFRAQCGRATFIGLIQVLPGDKLARVQKVEPPKRPRPKPLDWSVEANLYRPVLRYLRLSFPNHPSVMAGYDMFATIIANAKRVQTVPDLIMIARKPNAFLSAAPEIYSFEIKTRDNIKNNSHQQAAIQGQNANFSYLVWHCSDRRHRDDLKYTLRARCEAVGVGLIILAEPYDHRTYEVFVTARKRVIDEDRADRILVNLLNPLQKERARQWLERDGTR